MPTFNIAKKKLVLEQCRKYAESHGGVCHSTEYVATRTPMEWECAKGHHWWAKADEVLPRGKIRVKGRWCRLCANESRRKFSSEQDAEITRRLLAGEMVKDLAAELGCIGKTIRKSRRRQGLDELPRKVPIHNESAFSPLTPEGEYWIGFLLADGCVTGPNNNIVYILLKHTDEAHLYSFKTFVGADHPVHRYGNRSSIRFASSKIAADIARYGIVPRKTFIAKALNGVEKSRHFWRGVVDGDGCLGINRRTVRGKTYSYPRLELCGSEELMWQFYKFVTDFTTMKRSWPRPMGSIFRITIHAPAQDVIGFLYKDCSIALSRKLRLAKAISNI